MPLNHISDQLDLQRIEDPYSFLRRIGRPDLAQRKKELAADISKAEKEAKDKKPDNKEDNIREDEGRVCTIRALKIELKFFKFQKKEISEQKKTQIGEQKDQIYNASEVINISHEIKFEMASNNLFCSCTNMQTKNTVNVCNSGKFKIVTSKRKLKHTFLIIFNKFIAETNEKVKIIGLLFTLSCPKRLQSKLLKNFTARFKNIPMVVNVLAKKVFNGCRPAKKVRKKRRIMRIFK